MDVSTWFALRDLRKEARFGVNASEEDGIVVETEKRQGAMSRALQVQRRRGLMQSGEVR